MPFVGDTPLDAIRQEGVDRLVAQLLRANLSRKTVNNVTSVLSALMRYVVKNKLIAIDLSFNIQSQDVEITALAATDVDKIVAACCDARYRAAILLAADAGQRVGEMRALQWRPDVNMLAREITVSRSFDRTNALTETKGWERRVIPVSDRLWAALSRLDDSKRYVLARRADDRPLRYDGVREVIRAV